MTPKKRGIAVFTVCAFCFLGGTAFVPLLNPAPQIVELDLIAQLNQGLTISLGSTVVTFSGLERARLAENVPALENPVEITVRATGIGNSEFVLEVLANGDLESGENRIPISHITWTAANHSPSNPRGTFYDGTMSREIQRPAGRWQGSSWRTGLFEFFYYHDLQPPGRYAQTVTFTLSLP